MNIPLSSPGNRLLAIIPAKGTSRGVPHKNIRIVKRNPLIHWSIWNAWQSKYVQEVVVSTDSEQIAEIALGSLAKVIFRPPELATDDSLGKDVILHTLAEYSEFDHFIWLQPTSPLRTAEHIDEAYEFFLEKKASSIVSVCKSDYPLLWCNTLPADLSMDNFLNEKARGKHRQSFPDYYRLNGAISICTVEKFLEEESFFLKSGTYAYVMGYNESIDIDTELDIKIAELLFDEQRWDCARRDEWNPKYRKE